MPITEVGFQSNPPPAVRMNPLFAPIVVVDVTRGLTNAEGDIGGAL